jgi:hypothetical protein
VTASSDASRPVHFDPDVSLVDDFWRSGVDSDANPDRARGETFYRGGCRRESTRRRRESNKEGIPLRIDLDAAIRAERFAQDAAMLHQGRRILNGAQAVQQLRRTLNVREEEADRSGRELALHLTT